MSVTAPPQVSQFMALYVESQGRTNPDFSAAEESALDAALAQFQLSTTQLEQVDKLLEALEVMRGMVASGSLPSTSLDAIELSIQMMLQAPAASPINAPVPLQAQPLPADVQAFSDEYLTSTYLQDGTVWPGADAHLQADLRQFELAPHDLAAVEVAVATQYMYSIADQRRYLAAIDAALKAPDGFLYATPGTPAYQAYLNYTQVRSATAAEIDAYVATVQQILAGALDVADTSFDPVPWSAQLTNPQTAAPPSSALDQARFEIKEDQLTLSQISSQARALEGQVTQLNSLLATKTPPLTSEQIVRYTTQRADARRMLSLISAEFVALQARMKYNTAIAAGTAMSANASLRVDLDVDFAQVQIAAFVPRPVDTGLSDPVPTTTVETALAADLAAYADLVGSSQSPPPEDPDAPPPPPPPTLKRIEGTIDHIAYLLDVPTGARLTSEQTDEFQLLWAHREALRTEYRLIDEELTALKNRIDYAQRVLAGATAYTTSQWNTLTVAVAATRSARLAAQAVPPVSGAITTRPPETVAWKLSGGNPNHVQITRIENFLLTPAQNDWVYEQLDAFGVYVGRVNSDTQAAAAAKAVVQATISAGLTGNSLTNAQRQLAALNALIALYPTFGEDAAIGYDNAESARTVTDVALVNAGLTSVETSLESLQHDDYLVAQQKMPLADANYRYHYPNGGSDPRAVYLLAISTLSINVYNQTKYTWLAATATNETTRDGYLGTLATYEAAYPGLLTATLASYFDAAYDAASTGEWPRTLSPSLSSQEKADEVTAYYAGNVYPIIDPLQTTILPASVT